MNETTTEAGTLSVTWHSHTDRWQRAWVGRNVPWWQFRDRTEREVRDLLAARWVTRSDPASEYDGMLIRVDGILVGKLDTVGLDLVDGSDRATLIDWSWPSTFEDGGAVTVGQIVAAGKAGNL